MPVILCVARVLLGLSPLHGLSPLVGDGFNGRSDMPLDCRTRLYHGSSACSPVTAPGLAPVAAAVPADRLQVLDCRAGLPHCHALLACLCFVACTASDLALASSHDAIVASCHAGRPHTTELLFSNVQGSGRDAVLEERVRCFGRLLLVPRLVMRLCVL